MRNKVLTTSCCQAESQCFQSAPRVPCSYVSEHNYAMLRIWRFAWEWLSHQMLLSVCLCTGYKLAKDQCPWHPNLHICHTEKQNKLSPALVENPTGGCSGQCQTTVMFHLYDMRYTRHTAKPCELLSKWSLLYRLTPLVREDINGE